MDNLIENVINWVLPSILDPVLNIILFIYSTSLITIE